MLAKMKYLFLTGAGDISHSIYDLSELTRGFKLRKEVNVTPNPWIYSLISNVIFLRRYYLPSVTCNQMLPWNPAIHNVWVRWCQGSGLPFNVHRETTGDN